MKKSDFPFRIDNGTNATHAPVGRFWIQRAEETDVLVKNAKIRRVIIGNVPNVRKYAKFYFATRKIKIQIRVLPSYFLV